MDVDAGLCGDCKFAQLVRSSRGASYSRCGLAGERPGFVRYPRLPVLECEGHESRGRASEGGER